ncbi:hypothetical protein [Patulibacter sp.]|uniref:hypothetical protein n=1 Tax=Patulibacter sp. TaxID=1912859 RepID=UPI002724CFA5|nr:hypothetical protein [Patulibacter sp.]MDO9406876.1 hypothetical protein [Patulibacter sp.]
MSTAHETHAASAGDPPTLESSLRSFAQGLAAADRPDALHQLFYGFYSRVAVVDRSTHELARWVSEEITGIDDLPPTLAEALRDNALHVGRELFATRIQTMTAMGYVSRQLGELRGAIPADQQYTLDRAVAFDGESGELRTYALDAPGGHPDLPYDPFAYDPNAVDPTG